MWKTTGSCHMVNLRSVPRIIAFIRGIYPVPPFHTRNMRGFNAPEWIQEKYLKSSITHLCESQWSWFIIVTIIILKGNWIKLNHHFYRIIISVPNVCLFSNLLLHQNIIMSKTRPKKFITIGVYRIFEHITEIAIQKINLGIKTTRSPTKKG